MRELICSLLLLIGGVVTVGAQVEPQISTEETVYEYYMSSVGNQILTVRSDADANILGYANDATYDRAKVRLVKAGTDTEGDYYYIIIANAGGTVGTSATTVGTRIKYSGDGIVYTKWRKKQKSGDTDAWYFTSVDNDAVAFTAYSTTQMGLFNYGSNVNNNAYRWKFYPANDNALALISGITTGYYRIKPMRKQATYLRNVWTTDGTVYNTNRTSGYTATNNYIWKVDVEGDNFALTNGQGTPLKVDGVEYENLQVELRAGTNTYAFTINLHCNDNTTGIQLWENGGITEVNQWKFESVEGTPYDVVITGAPEGATVTRTATEETALDGGFFMYATDATPQASEFTATEVPGKFPEFAIDNTAKTITVTYKRPVVPTTIVDGQFAEDTQWYVMQFTSSKYYVTDNGTADRIKLTSRSYGQDKEFWCFVANEDGSYKIYNKEAGPTKVLASSSDMSDGGAYTYPTLQEEASLPEDYVGSWDFSVSTSIANEKGWYLALHGHSSAVMNDNANRHDLAFWTGGKGAGSTFLIIPAEFETTISLNTGAFSGTSTYTYHSTWSSSEFPGLTFSTSANNMMVDNDDASLISCFTGSSDCTYTLSAPAGYVIKSYSLDYYLRSDNASANVTINGVAATTTPTTLSDADYNQRYMSFDQGGNNKGVTLSNFNVVIAKQVVPIEESYEVFISPDNGVVHRIPAIAQAKNGDIIAVADYRHSGQDIGLVANGELDLHVRRSSDYGKTWTDIAVLADGEGAEAITDQNNTNVIDVAFGDPCIVADRESNEVLVLSCAGNVSYTNGDADNHQYIVAMRSHDKGVNWDKRVDITDQFYGHFNNETNTMVKAMFIGSGKISQSQYIKKAGSQYYRIYCAVLFKDMNNVEKNYVYYSDDFGATWDVLGGVNVAPIPSGANEPKADELPDGSVVVSSRISGGRKFNIFQYTDPLTAEGSWGTVATSVASNNGTVAKSNSTNGEILTVPVKRKADGQKMFLFLQSVPLGPNRANVGIYYKALESLSDFDTPDNLAKDWDGHYQACYFSSAYSTMTWLDNNTLGFLYEEDINGSAYSIVYKNYTIETLTGDQYEYCADVDESVMLKEGLDERLEAVKDYVGPYVGNLTYGGYMSISNAYDLFMETPTKMQYAAFNKAVAEAEYRQIKENVEYRINNKPYPAKYLTLQASGLTTAALDENSATQKLTFHASGTSWKIKGDEAWICKTNANDACPNVTTDENAETIGLYDVIFDAPGTVYIRCTNPGNASRPYLHLSNGTTLMSWISAAETSLWRIQPVNPDADELIGNIILDCEDELAMAGKVGYPAADDETIAPFQEAFNDAKTALTNNNATEDIYNDLVAKRTAYKSVTDVVMPEDGKAYTITSVNINGVKRYMYYKEAGYDLAVVPENGELPETAVLICRKVGEEQYAFVNTAGKYFKWKGSGSSGTDIIGYVDEYNVPVEGKTSNTVLTVEKLVKGTNDDIAVTQDKLFGYMAMKGNRGNGETPNYFVIKTAGGYDQAGATLFNSGFTSALLIEEVSDFRNKISFLKLNEDDFYVATYSAPYATVLPEGVTAYAAVAKAEDAIQTAPLKGTGTAIPANTGVLLASRAEIDPQHMAPATVETVKDVPAGNKLKPSGAPTEGGSTYVLSYMLEDPATTVGFYSYDVANTQIGTYRAYLELSAAPSRKLRIIFGDDIETGIDSIEGAENADSNTTIYDLSGRRIQNPVKGGLYIKGGVKYVHQ